MKLESLKNGKFDPLSSSQMSTIRGGGYTATGAGETATRRFRSDNEFRNGDHLLFNDVTYDDGKTERIWIAAS